MAIPVKSNLDLGQNQLLNIVIHVTSSDPGSPVDGQLWYNSTSHLLKFRNNGSTHTLADLNNSLSDFTQPSGDVAWNTHKITGLLDPTGPQDAATKNYVDNTSLGLDVHASVRCASTGNVVVASGLTNGVAIDGITVATGDRVLLKSQTAPAENGIYIVAVSGAAARATDLTTAAQYVSGVFVFVEIGTINGATGWLVTTQGAIVVGTTSVTWTQMSSSATYVAGSGLTLTGNSFAVNVTGNTTEISGGNVRVKSNANTGQPLLSGGAAAEAAYGALNLAGGVTAVTGILPTLNGGTGGSTAATARTALAATTKYAADIGDGSTTSIVVTHSLGTTDVLVQVHDKTTPFEVFQLETQITSTNTITLVFSVAPTTNQYRIIVIG